ncbi:MULTISPECIES: MBL fold metallo-hydrolase [unclassified Actinopolyspora]|uniref:MBL fold metallo-hydrolase n=1 Tax=unclassified Actinopolyspora TaxID=2639451 RepID=UPI0013F5D371|nr:MULTISPECIES: MBL fold metallo-hydrolase [unclassified Actinopolyspora]NHD17660.1 MBL fold metallo-hydrolase [Actinopolyspora sp. BKK2]NHE76607.1 MBL fold metallo-hydrolase [Actinopolyspora sp. BKK1]
MVIRFQRRRSFADRLDGPLPTVRDVLRFMWRGAPRRTVLDRRLVPLHDGPLPGIEPHDVAATWIGHATFLLRAAGCRVVTDPVWSTRIPGVSPRLSPPGLALGGLLPVDAVLISHNHYDHLDAATLARFPRSTPVLVPLGLGNWFTRRGFTDVRELDWWDSTELGPLRFDFVPARHWSRRGVWDFCRSLWGGWVVTVPDGRRLYHAGDTGYGPFLAEIGRRFPGIELAMLPIGAYHPPSVMRSVHLTPEDAVAAAADTGAVRLAGMHWATFPLTGEPVLQPWERLRAAWFAAGGSGELLWDLAVGETRVLPGARSRAGRTTRTE